MSQQDEWVEVLVPKHLVPDVYGLVAAQMKALNGAAGDSAIERMYVESPPAMKKFFEHLASHSGEARTTADLCEALGLKPAQLAGALGAFGRRRKNRYPGAPKPFAAEWDHEHNTWTYRMDQDASAEVKRLAAEN